MSEGKLKIDRFSGNKEDWHEWRFEGQAYLTSMGYGLGTTGSYDLTVEKNKANNQMMYSMLYMVIDSKATTCKRALRDPALENDGQAAWKALCALMEDDPVQVALGYLMKLINVDLSNHSDVKDYLFFLTEMIGRLRNALTAAKIDWSEVLLMAIVTRDLSSHATYGQVLTSLRTNDKNTWSVWYDRLLTEAKISLDGSITKSGAAFNAQVTASASGNCSSCHQSGHYGPGNPACPNHDPGKAKKCFKCGGKYPCTKCNRGFRKKPSGSANALSGEQLSQTEIEQGFIFHGDVERVADSDDLSISDTDVAKSAEDGSLAMSAYALFHRLPESGVTIEQVAKSAAGLEGWTDFGCSGEFVRAYSSEMNSMGDIRSEIFSDEDIMAIEGEVASYDPDMVGYHASTSAESPDEPDVTEPSRRLRQSDLAELWGTNVMRRHYSRFCSTTGFGTDSQPHGIFRTLAPGQICPISGLTDESFWDESPHEDGIVIDHGVLDHDIVYVSHSDSESMPELVDASDDESSDDDGSQSDGLSPEMFPGTFSMHDPFLMHEEHEEVDHRIASSIFAGLQASPILAKYQEYFPDFTPRALEENQALVTIGLLDEADPTEKIPRGEFQESGNSDGEGSGPRLPEEKNPSEIMDKIPVRDPVRYINISEIMDKIPKVEHPDDVIAGPRLPEEINLSESMEKTLDIPVDTGCTGTHVTPDPSDINHERISDTSLSMRGAISKAVMATSSHTGGMAVTIIDAKSGRDALKTVITGVAAYPAASRRLLSADRFTERGWITETGRTYGKLRHEKSGKVIYLSRKNGLYCLRVRFNPNTDPAGRPNANPGVGNALAMGPMESPKMLAHFRLGHVNRNDLEAVRSLAKGVEFPDNSPWGFCPICPIGKSHKLPVAKTAQRSESFCELWYFDMQGPYGTVGRNGEKYSGLFVEDSTTLRMLFTYKDKTGKTVTRVLTSWHQKVRNLVGEDFIRIRLRMDGDRASNDIRDVREWCADAQSPAVVLEYGGTYTPQHIGRAERSWRTLFSMACCMLKYAGLPKEMIFDAMLHAVWIVFRLPTSALNGQIPFFVVNGEMPDLKMAKIFGCVAFAHVDHTRRNKMDDKSRKGKYFGVKDQNYKIWIKDQKPPNDILLCRDVTFDESWMGTPTTAVGTTTEPAPHQLPAHRQADSQDTPPAAAEVPLGVHPRTPAQPAQQPQGSYSQSETDGDSGPEHLADTASTPVQQADTTLLPNKKNKMPAQTAGPSNPPAIHGLSPNQDIESPNHTRSGTTYSVHTQCENGEHGFYPPREMPLYRPAHDARAPDSHLQAPDPYYQHMCMGADIESRTPKTYDEAMNGPDAPYWKKAVEEELESLRTNDTWSEEAADGVHPRDIVRGVWVFKIKQNDKGEVIRFKARFCARGYTQLKGVNYEETHAPVVRMQNVLLLMALAAEMGLELMQNDVDTAYLYGEIDALVYITPPEGYVQESKSGPVVLRLSKGLYGLKQSGHLWNERLVKYMLSIGYEQLKSDPCLFKYEKDGALVIVAVYVDDLISFGRPRSAVEAFTDVLEKEFRIKRLGDLTWYSNMTIERDRSPGGFVKVHQEAYVKAMCEDHGLATATPRNEPMAPKTDVFALVKTGKPMLPGRNIRAAVGQLIWTTITRPTALHSVGLLTRIMHQAKNEHYELAKGVMKYLKKDISNGLVFNNNPKMKPNTPEAWCDSSWADADEMIEWGNPKIDDRERRSTTGYAIFMNDGLISRLSKRQDVVAMSSPEAETGALKSCIQEVLYVRNVLQEIGFPIEGPTTIWVDNAGAVSYASNPQYRGRRSMRHLELQNSFIRQEIAAGHVAVVKVAGDKNLADIFTKTQDAHTFQSMAPQFEG